MNFFKRINLNEYGFTEVWSSIKSRNFTGNRGQAIKNSAYQFSTNLTAKIGSFVFTIILARLLMPELFGLYSLALSIIVIFSSIAELGIGAVLVMLVSKEFNKKTNKIKQYLLYLGKIKIWLILLLSLILAVSANYIANIFYQKPIFLALLSGILYIPFTQATNFLRSLLEASNNFNPIFKSEIIFQILRVILIPLAIISAIKYSMSNETNLMMIILFLALSFLISSIFLFFKIKNIYFKKITVRKPQSLSKKQKGLINNLIFTTGLLVLSGVFFGNVDRIMLGKFISAEFIGYYSAALGLIAAIIPLTGFVAAALLPIFSRLKGERLETGFKKSLKVTIPFSILIFLLTISLSYIGIIVAYGNQYLPAVNILRILSMLLLISPIIAIYQSYYLSQNKTGTIAKLLLVSTLLNIFLNYILIVLLIPSGEIAVVYGVSIATVLSQIFYTFGLIFNRKR